MMKRMIAVLCCLLLMASLASAENVFDNAALRQMENAMVFNPTPGSVDTVVRPPLNQPYIGQVDEPYDGFLVAYVDYIILPDYDATLLRLMVATEAFDPIKADEMRLTVSGRRYTFAMDSRWEEYDGIYMEDYTTCLTDASLPLLKAIAQTKQDAPIPVEFLSLGEVVFAGQVVIPGDDAADLYDRFINLGGKKQDLKKLDDVWPCKVEK